MSSATLPARDAGVLASIVAASCCALRGSSVGGEARFDEPRLVDLGDVAVSQSYRVERVASGLTFPTGVCWNDQRELHVVESGYGYGEVWTTP